MLCELLFARVHASSGKVQFYLCNATKQQSAQIISYYKTERKPNNHTTP